MGNDKKIWGLIVNFGIWGKDHDELPFEQEAWDFIVDESSKTGLNTLIFDIGGGVDFASHPELTLKGAWTRSKLREELAKCKEKGLAVIPKLNFATSHDYWLGKYHRMISTPEYYKVCNDLIKEAYELFEHPEYIHLGMDEEDYKHVKNDELPVFRQGQLFWHDLRFLIDSVKDTGAKPWIWACPLFDHPEEYKAHIDADEALISPWYYQGLNKDHWIEISSRQDTIEYYKQEEYKGLNIKYVEDDPWCVHFREVALPLLSEGYKYVPCASSVGNPHNSEDLLEYFKENAPEDQIVGYMTSAWKHVLNEHNYTYAFALKKLKEARDKFYK